ncbi:MAG: glycerate kinase [Leucobacter sp.]
MVRVVIAPDSFKGSLAAAEVAEAIAEGWLSARPDDEVMQLPLADGGEGTLAAFAAALPDAARMPVSVSGPVGESVDSEWLFLPRSDSRPHSLGVVELANTSGIELLPDELQPFEAHTLGFGEAIRAALEHGVDGLVLAIGSSASTDGGSGMLRALGARITRVSGAEIGLGAKGLGAVYAADLSGLLPLPAAGVTVLTDVTAPLFGSHGAAAVFGPQKGLSPLDVPVVDDGLRRYAEVMSAVAGTPEAAMEAGAGAAGGTGFGLLLWGATLMPGASRVAELVDLAGNCAGADVVITGEGRFDAQSALGKVPGLALEYAASAGARPILIAGDIADDLASTSALEQFGASLSLTELAGSREDALARPAHWLHRAAREAARRV